MSKFKSKNILADLALIELRNRLEEISVEDVAIKNKEEIVKIFKVKGEPNWNEEYVVITEKHKILNDILEGTIELSMLNGAEWGSLLTPPKSNKLLYKYFRKLNKAYRTNLISNSTYTSAFDEITRLLQEKWDAIPVSSKNKIIGKKLTKKSGL